MYLRIFACSVLILLSGCRGGTPRSAGTTSLSASGIAGEQELRLCVLLDDDLRYVAGQRHLLTGDTLVDGKPFRNVYPASTPPYALNAPWLYKELITLRGATYTAYGPPQILTPDGLIRVGEFRGIPLFAEEGTQNSRPGMLLVPLRPGCEFQPYIGFNDFVPLDTTQ